ncbi:siderophore-interacting protein [Allosaccharopolyspora coralli]|uniref:Siderophore-interacting protein n=1 Tax=Allosaccharopolyspora coralli TaxID=2665642 RepID=A0A5Q3Q9N6_9PSEU|nr:siderophore-interacting protein [Allosaccharopolyspora coralli]QGK70056.1 siderophore-interacting protein [Allosaccharopolyspora coralli]
MRTTTTAPAHRESAPAARTDAAPAFAILRATVTAVRKPAPDMVRLTLGGEELAWMTNGGLDQRIKLLFPRSGQDEPVLPADRGYPALRLMPEEQRPHVRTYTVRAHRPQQREFDVDVVLHGDAGPGSSFARYARPGDRLAVFVPHVDHPHPERLSGVEFRTERVVDDVVLVGDETALPAMASILDEVPADVRVRALVEVPEVVDTHYLRSGVSGEIRWLARGDRPRGEVLLREVRALDLADPYVWIAGESRTVTSVRRTLVDEFGVDRRRITFLGYWRCGATEDAARANPAIATHA